MTSPRTETNHRELAWDPPGPGTWEFDAAHQQRPYPASMLDWAETAIEEGFRAGFAMIGVPLDTMAIRSVHGWAYMHAVPLGGKDGGGPTPPKFVLSVLFRLVPALRRRHATARSVFVDRPWNDLVSAWQSTGRPEALARHVELATVDVEACKNDELASHLVAVHGAAADAYRVHFTHAAPAAAITGRFALRTNELTGQPIDNLRIRRTSASSPLQSALSLRPRSPISADSIPLLAAMGSAESGSVPRLSRGQPGS